MPTGDTGAAQFVAAHPTWDGRNTVIGILDSGVSLDHPSLLTTSTGARKVIDWVTYTHPTDDADPTWVNMQDQVSGAAFTYQTVAYTAPAAGSYRIGLFEVESAFIRVLIHPVTVAPIPWMCNGCCNKRWTA